MFDRKAQAEAVILDDQGSGHTITRDLHGVDWDHHKYIVEVRPAGQAAFRVEAKTKVPIFSAPQPGDPSRFTGIVDEPDDDERADDERDDDEPRWTG
jgi:hypothetical protein